MRKSFGFFQPQTSQSMRSRRQHRYHIPKSYFSSSSYSSKSSTLDDMLSLWEEIANERKKQNKFDALLIEECKSHRPRFKKMLQAIKLGAQWERSTDVDGFRFAVQCSALHCETAFTFDLMRRLGASFLTPDKEGNQFVHVATDSFNDVALEWWLQQDYPLDHRNQLGLTPFEVSLFSGNHESFIRLVKALKPQSLTPSIAQDALDRLTESIKKTPSGYDYLSVTIIDALLELGAIFPPHHELSMIFKELSHHELYHRVYDLETQSMVLQEQLELGLSTPKAPENPKSVSKPRKTL